MEKNRKIAMENMLDFIEQLCNEYESMVFAKKQIYDFVKQEIESYTFTLSSVHILEECSTLKSLIIKELNQQVEKKWKEYPHPSKLVGDYIERHFKTQNDYSKDVKQMEEICEFFSKIEYSLESYICIELIKSNKVVYRLLEQMVNKNLSLLKQGKCDVITNSDHLCFLLTVFYDLNKRKEEDELDLDHFENALNMNYEDMKELDSVKMYLQSIRVPLLTEQEERKILVQVAEGNEKAKKILLERNLCLVASIAKKYCQKGVSFLDLVQEGNIGLMKAIERFDITKGTRFSTYASWWIKREIRFYVYDHSRTIQLSREFHLMINRYKNVIIILKQDLGREPKLEEIAEKLNITLEETKLLEKWNTDIASTNEEVTEDGIELEDLFADETDLLEDMVIKNSLSEEIQQLLLDCHIEPRVYQVLSSSYGLGGQEKTSRKELCKQLKISYQRIDQLENSAIKTLRTSPYIQKFAEYMDDPKQSLQNIEQFRIDYLKKEIAHKLKDCLNGRCKKFITGQKTLLRPDCEKIIKIMKSTELSPIIKQLTETQVVIISLYFGYIDGITFDQHSIAILLGISEEMVEQAIRDYENQVLQVKNPNKTYVKVV